MNDFPIHISIEIEDIDNPLDDNFPIHVKIEIE